MSRIDPTGRLLAVVDAPDRARGVAQALATAGLSGVDCLAGEPGVARLDRSGRQGGLRVRLARLLSYLTADQSVDLATYEAALRDGRAVLVVPAPTSEARERALTILREANAHFVNFYGPMMTEDIIPWRGEQLAVPYRFHR